MNLEVPVHFDHCWECMRKHTWEWFGRASIFLSYERTGSRMISRTAYRLDTINRHILKFPVFGLERAVPISIHNGDNIVFPDIGRLRCWFDQCFLFVFCNRPYVIHFGRFFIHILGWFSGRTQACWEQGFESPGEESVQLGRSGSQAHSRSIPDGI